MIGKLLLLVACLGFTTASAGPAKKDKGEDAQVTDEQLEYSKQLFAEGEKAMKKKDYATAQEKYREAYRYAPHLHLFTYNIASAAEAMDDCRSAHYFYGQFLALVPEHPERDKVSAKVEQMQKLCPIEQAKDGEIVTKTREERERERSRAEALRVMNEALWGLETGAKLYTEGAKRFPKQKAFAKAARRKKWHAKRMRKVLANHDVKVETPEESAPPQLPADPKQACKIAKAHERRTIDALEKVLDKWDSRESYRVVSRFLRGAEKRDEPAFDACLR